MKYNIREVCGRDKNIVIFFHQTTDYVVYYYTDKISLAAKKQSKKNYGLLFKVVQVCI